MQLAHCLPVVALALLCIARQEPTPPLETPRPVDGDERVHVGDLGGLDCARCHAVVADEWAATLHAFAWTDPHYQEEIADRRKPQSCHGCHIPRPVHLTGLDQKPVAREDALHLGVTCEACHAGPDGAILGPRGTPTDAHPSRVAESFVGAGTNALCATCHGTFVGPVLGLARDFADSGQAERGATCVGCHMAEVERSFASTPADAEGVPAREAPVRKGRSHALQTPRDPGFLPRAFALSARREGQRAVLVVENRAGHRVPGLIGREIVLEVCLLASDGRELARKELSIDASAPLLVDVPLRVEFESAGARLRVHGRHVDPRLLQPVDFLETELALEP